MDRDYHSGRGLPHYLQFGHVWVLTLSPSELVYTAATSRSFCAGVSKRGDERVLQEQRREKLTSKLEKMSAGALLQNAKVRTVPVQHQGGGCALCRDDGFKVTFGPQTLMICTQCEKEYHVGCLKRYCIEDLEELPRGSWFCSNNCRDIHSGLMNLVASGDNSIPEHFQKLMRKKQGVGLDIKWRLLNRKLFPWDDTNPLLSKAHAIFGERFRLMFESDGADVIRGMILGKNLEDQDLSGFYCAVLTVGRSVVSAALFRVLGSQIAEVPLVATSIKHDGKGYFQCLFGCIERFLASLGVDSFVLHACQQAKPMWIRKFRFSKLGKSEIKHLKRNYKLISLERTELLRKPVEEEN
ncbi:hypothetical protein P8452_10687 [Trifolium repens]|nr:hypothetical protein P8452_10687 [Trifolium repens]